MEAYPKFGCTCKKLVDYATPFPISQTWRVSINYNIGIINFYKDVKKS